jgi:D-threo-aldose 1-dehydrogenase
MTVQPFEKVGLGRTPLQVTRLGLGMAPLGGLYEAVSDEQAATVLGHAWDLGIRYYDAAPLYGYGLAEQRLGRLLAGHDHSEWVMSTKVGRLLYPLAEVEADPGLDRDWQALGSVDGSAAGGEVDWYYRGVPDVRPVYDYSYDGVMRSVEASLQRTGLDRLDILWIHDPDNHWEQAIGGAYPALHRLREEGAVSAIGAGMNQAEMLTRFAREGDFDALMCAGRYTLLDQAALEELFPVCEEKGIAIVIAGVMNSGLLANPGPDSHFNYGPAPQEWIDKALRIKAVCDRHGVPLRAAAIQFVYAHPVVASVVAGVRTVPHLDDTVEKLGFPIPDALWDDLRAEGLLAPGTPTPVAGA